MPVTVTTSVRLPIGLKRRLQKQALASRCGRNRLIIAALEQFLARSDQADYETEARRQSLLTRKLDRADDGWEKMVAEDLGGP